MKELRSSYLAGRAWLTLGFQTTEGIRIDLPLVVDTGCPVGLILGADPFEQLSHIESDPIVNNYGKMTGGWFQLYMPELNLVEKVRGYESRELALGVALDDPSFRGLVGLPILRLGEYGGNASEFWFRYPPP